MADQRRRGAQLLCLACAAGLFMMPGLPAPAAANDPGLAAIDRVATESFTATGLPGMALAVTRGQNVVLVKGYGSAGDGRPVTAQTQFRLASLSKSVTALAVMQLAAAATVDLDAPIRGYLPNFTVADASAADRITVRQLLTMTSGLSDAGFDADDARTTRLADRLAALHAASPVAEPGREFHYFEPNYQVLAALVTKVAGVPFEDYLDQQVFTPLGMDSTVSTVTAQEAAAVAPQLAQGHILVFGRPVARNELNGFMAGSAGVVSTAADMARWLIVHSSDGRLGDRRVLSAQGIQTLHTPPAGIATDYAMGWTTAQPGGGPRRLVHTGVLSTFSAEQMLLPDSGYGIAVLFDGNYALADTAGVADRIAALLTGATPTRPVPRTLIVAVTLAVLTVGTLALRGHALLRRRSWARRRRSAPWWRLAPGLTWLLLPAVLLIALPALMLWVSDRAFTYQQLALAMPDVTIWLAVSAITGAALGAGRLITRAQVRRKRTRYPVK